MLGVAKIAVAPGHQAREHAGAAGEIVRIQARRQLDDVTRDGGEMGAGGAPIGVGGVDTGQLQGGVGEVDLLIVQLANGFKNRLDVAQSSLSCLM
jgi:hypothetical protein